MTQRRSKKPVQIEARKSEDGGANRPFQRNYQAISPQQEIFTEDTTPQGTSADPLIDRQPRVGFCLSSFEQIANFKFGVKLKKTFTEILALMNEAYEDEKLSRTQVYFWYKGFKDGSKSIADDSRSGRLLTLTTDRNIGQIRDLIVALRKYAIDNISEILGISYGSFQKIIAEHLKKLCFLFNPQTKKQSLEWHTPSSPRKKKVHLDKSKGKVMLVVFFDNQGLGYYEFIKEGITINKQAYKNTCAPS
ncbi:hypothetical protein LAZ67_2003523 [Cordylochernes scorpioides]|uniref:Mos1 transposase HTH domain-containing protein n=1 Tax=Cordylochernes scorpioides TaxID=51811 RepID=A0ABY6K4K5_9ARAC|nr:hypothetical protein LAZ67_2003523 [Cordylochernes scorpioides]